MYNVFVYNPDLVDRVIIERDCIAYLYTFSLRCSDEYRAISNKLSDVKITSKIIKRNKGVLIEHLQNYIQYAIDTFLKCLNKESYVVFARNRVKLFEISAVGAANMKLRKSGNLKRRKAPEGQLSVPKGTTVEHYLQLIRDTWISWINFLK
ncbi:hypothetical protein BY458DRAFT_486344 [Sporodiniella umbellata]|nr:hypothetical protein BY458DRAFT_486344 [Sporodiniella umbellata]